MKRSPITRIAIALILAIFASVAAAEVQMPNIFGHHMVLQQGMTVPVWGTASPGEKITVTLGEQKKQTDAEQDGKWRIDLAPMEAGGPHRLVVSGSERYTLSFADVMIGEVWVCSGQSNMQWPVHLAANAEQEIAAADHPNIRLYTVERRVTGQPQDDAPGNWSRCTPQTVRDFSAVGYFFGRYLRKELDVPVGLIHTSWGGTPAESWTSREMLLAHPQTEGLVRRWDEAVKTYSGQVADYISRYDAWADRAEELESQGKPIPQPPKAPGNDPRVHSHRASGLFNAMINPLIPYAIRGAIWYQGESNAPRAYQYRTLFPAMITDWRERWGEGDFPFLFVQLANFRPRLAEPAESDWAELREAQLMTLSLPKTGMAVTIDIGEGDNIHPKNKQDVGKRLALNALAIEYGRDVPHTGPMLDRFEVRDGKCVLKFNNTAGGLQVRGGGELEGFTVAGPDKKFHWADAHIEGNDTVIVTCDAVKDPKAVRYAWADNPANNLTDGAGLPASPFRTDDWPGVTANNQ